MTKSDTKPCSNQYQGVTARTTLDTWIDPAGTGDWWWYTDSTTPTTRSKWATSKGGGFWFVYAEGAVYYASTYAQGAPTLP